MGKVISRAVDVTDDIKDISNKYSNSLKVLRKYTNLNDRSWKVIEDNAFLNELAKN